MVRDNLKKLITKAIKKAQQEKKLPEFIIPQITIEHPEKKEHGDYSTNIAMVCSKLAKKATLEIAQALDLGADFLAKTNIIKPGFINFYLRPSFWQEQIEKIIEQENNFGQLKQKEEKVAIEFISANPTGQLHIGHGRGAFFGDTLRRVLHEAGYQTTAQYYVNDAQDSAQIKEFGKTVLGQGETYLTDYVRKKIAENKEEIDKCQNEGEAGSLLAQKIQADIQQFITKELKIEFDQWFSEQKDLFENKQVNKTFQQLKEKDLVYAKEGAQWLKTTKFGEKQDWVIVRQSGDFTYLLPDIAYHQQRFKKYDKVINIWGADHQGHVGKIKAVAKIFNYQGQIDFLITQVVRLKGEKMSKRKGKTITLKELIKEVGLDATRFMYLLKSLDSQMEFDMDLAKKQSQKNPVYYVQYAYARICSIFRKADIKLKTDNLDLLKEEAELNLIKKLLQFPELIEDTALDYQIHHLPHYAMELAATFHQFYNSCQVLGDNKELSQARLALVKACQITLKNVLEVIGISAPEKM